MQITFLGHAGFLVETAQSVVALDPWLSPEGAFDSAWMQLPCNHHLADWLREKLSRPDRARFVYVSHEHRDHFDPAFLRSLPRQDFTVVLPRFRRAALRNAFAYHPGRVVLCDDGERVPLPDGELRLFLTDAGLNRDSALLVRAEGRTFLDLNDCKLHDRLPRIAAEEGAMDVFSAQFSGAIWHPTCYEYDRALYGALSRRKLMGKFEAVARALEALRPKAYVAAAGPACFLDPALIHLNFEKVNVFPRAEKLFGYLERRLEGAQPVLLEPMPGDEIDPASGRLTAHGTERLEEGTFEPYVRGYADRCASLYSRREERLTAAEVDAVHERLRDELSAKLCRLRLRERVDRPLYAWLTERPDRVLRVDFRRGALEQVPAVADEERHTFAARAQDVARVLDRRLTWEEFLLSFRFRLGRIPDRYDAVMHGYLACEVEDLDAFCDSVIQSETRPERTVVEAGGKRFEVQRFCPHQGADLSEAWIEGDRYLVCARHRWRFDLERGGVCPQNGSSILARCVGTCGEETQQEVAEQPAESVA